MNWYHGPTTWSELERVLSGRPGPRGSENPHPGDGSDAPAWSRKRDEYTPPKRPRARAAVPTGASTCMSLTFAVEIQSETCAEATALAAAAAPTRPCR